MQLECEGLYRRHPNCPARFFGELEQPFRDLIHQSWSEACGCQVENSAIANILRKRRHVLAGHECWVNIPNLESGKHVELCRHIKTKIRDAQCTVQTYQLQEVSFCNLNGTGRLVALHRRWHFQPQMCKKVARQLPPHESRRSK